MKILNAEFVTSAAADGGGIPRDGLPQVALAGRSNVGKSTLINALSRRSIARTSAAPGKTRLANVYRIDVESAGRRSVYLIDLPGYGYARGGGDSARELAAVAERYFQVRLAPDDGRTPEPGMTCLLVDARHPGLDADIHAFEWLQRLGVTPAVIATKVDKLSRAERTRNLREIGQAFGAAPLPVSASSGEGLDALWKLLTRLDRRTTNDAPND